MTGVDSFEEQKRTVSMVRVGEGEAQGEGRGGWGGQLRGAEAHRVHGACGGGDYPGEMILRRCP